MENFNQTQKDAIVRSESLLQEVPVTFATLEQDNRSEEAQRRRKVWAATRNKHQLIALGTCGDSRIWTPNPEITSTYRTIAAGGRTDLYVPIVTDSRVQAAIELVHFAGSTVQEGKTPGGCGGLHAKEQLGNGLHEHDEGIAAFIKDREKVSHPDPVVHSLITAAKIAQYTEKDILAAAMDHETMQVTPLAVFSKRGRQVISAINMRQVFEGQYNPRELYQGNKLPSLSKEELPDHLQAYLQLHAQNAALLRQHVPDLATRMRSQNPSVLDISNDNRPYGVAFPETSLPGRAFRLRLARGKNASGAVVHPDAAIEEVLQEAQYPVEHFDRLKTIMIRTGNMDDSRRVGQILARQPYMAEWMHKEGNCIIYAKNEQGVLTDAEEIKMH